MKAKSAALFFGSGISIASGAPRVDEITKNLLEKQWTRETNRTYGKRRADSVCDPGEALANQAQDFLKILFWQIRDHLLAKEEREPNYEDLFSAARQLFEDEIAEITNPMLEGSIEAVRLASAHLYNRYPDECGNRFATLADHSTDLIQSVVAQMLRTNLQRKNLEKIAELAKAIGHVDIFTLNHDLLVEEELANAKVKVSDGFGKANGGMTEFSWDWDTAQAKVDLFKLHGSINWHLVREPKQDIACRIGTDFESCRNRDGKLIRPLTTTPLFLTGTIVKERAYGQALFGDLFRKFHDVLEQHRTLICCGYGWSDKGINTRLDQWLRNGKENRLVVLHGHGGEPLQKKSFWLNRWELLHKAKKAVVIEKWLPQIKIDQLADFITDPVFAPQCVDRKL
jgi:hypothetical protein